ncbi:MAG: hypothetical protein K2K70_13510 [Lachnospiraceae bacterium]|nr:hypothetical protein [Lachnospiraceae bacterium]
MNRINKVEYNGQNTQYDYDVNGNQTSVVEKDSAAGTTKTDTYVYDELNQLTHMWKNTMGMIPESMICPGFRTGTSL